MGEVAGFSNLSSYPPIIQSFLKYALMIQVKISTREKEVLNLIAYEFSANEIAEKLFISPHTVITHRKKIQEKLNVRNTAGMIRVAFERGLDPIRNHPSLSYRKALALLTAYSLFNQLIQNISS